MRSELCHKLFGLAYTDVGHTQGAKQELVSLLDFERSEDVFNTVKPSSLIERILRISLRTCLRTPEYIMDETITQAKTIS